MSHSVEFHIGDETTYVLDFEGFDRADFQMDDRIQLTEGSIEVHANAKEDGSPLDASNIAEVVLLVEETLELGEETRYYSHRDALTSVGVHLGAYPDKPNVWFCDSTEGQASLFSLACNGLANVEGDEQGWSVPFVPAGIELVLFTQEPPTVHVVPDQDLQLGDPASADLLIVAGSDFHEALAPLIDRRTQQGWQPATVSPAWVYKRYSNGQPSPDAFSRLVSREIDNEDRSRPLRALLLVGDTTPGPVVATEDNPENLIPTAWRRLTDRGIWVPSDMAWLQEAMLECPDCSPPGVGRIPARSSAQVASAVSRILAYESANATQWTFIADDNDGIFKPMSETLRSALPLEFSAQTFYLEDYNNEYPLSDPPPANQYEEPAVMALRSDLHEDLTAGATRVVTYFGHGDLTTISAERIVSQHSAFDNLATILEHGDSPALWITYNCLNGYFAYPSLVHVLAESMILLDSNVAGAAATITTSAYSNPDQAMMLAERVQNRLLDPTVATLGEAFTGAVFDTLYPASGELGDDDVWTYVLLGDPSMPTPALLDAP